MPGASHAPRLLGITPTEFSARELATLLPGLSPHVDAVLLRWPGHSARTILEAARRLAEISPRPRLILSDRLDLALAARLDGVQLKEQGLPPESIPAELRPACLGASRHDEEGVRAASAVDYLTLSPVYTTSSKPGVEGMGIARFRECVALSPVPVLALGGVQPADLASLLEAGAHGAAISSGIFANVDPVAAASAYAKALREVRRA